MVVRPHLQRLVERIRMRPPLRRGLRLPLRPRLAAARALRQLRRLPRAGAGRTRGAASATPPTGPASTFRGCRSSTPPTTRAPPDSARRGARARRHRCPRWSRAASATSELLAPVAAPESGLRTERRLSHAVLPRPARDARGPAARRRAAQRRAEPRREARHRAQHGRPRARAGHSPPRRSRCSPRSTSSRPRFRRRATRRAEADGGAGTCSAARSSTAR